MTSPARLFGVVDKLLALFPRETGFEPYTFVAFAYGDEEGGRENLRRSFRYELNGCCTHLTVEAPGRSSWRRRLLGNLVRAGYEPWLSGSDSADVRRWLRTSSDRRRELRFLEDLGTTGELGRWPTRAATARPAETRQGRWSRAQWARVIDEVRDASVGWDDVTIGFSRSTTRAVPTRSGSVRIAVGLLTYWHPRHGKTLLVFASVSDVADVRGRRTPLPQRIARIFRRTLRDASFESDRVWSVRNGKLLTGRVGFQKKMTSESAAADVCERTYRALAELRISPTV